MEASAKTTDDDQDARVKIKAVAALHPYTFRAATRKPRKTGGGWAIETFGPWPSWQERLDTVRDSVA